MPELIAVIILISSLLGIGIIIYRKASLLLKLPEIVPLESNREKLLDKIKNFSFPKSFTFEIFLQKILSKIRILTLRTDSKTSNWLQKLREKSKKKKNKLEEDDYWQKLKSSTKQKE